jgi:hypothetical protein
MYSILTLVMMLVFITYAVYSVVFARRHLIRPGMSQEVRYVFTQKHINYVYTFMVFWIVPLSYNCLELVSAFNPGNKKIDNAIQIMNCLSITVGLFTGLVMSYIRTKEPYFRFKIKSGFKKYVLRKKEAIDSDEKERF